MHIHYDRLYQCTANDITFSYTTHKTRALPDVYSLVLKPQSHWIVRFLDRAIEDDLAELRPIGKVCYFSISGFMLRLI